MQEDRARFSKILYQDKSHDSINDIWVDVTGCFVVVQGGKNEDMTVYRWVDEGTLQKLGALKDTSSHVETEWYPEMAFHPQKNIIAIVGRDRPISIWDVETCTCIDLIVDPEDQKSDFDLGYWGISFSNCGQFLETHTLNVGEDEKFFTGRRYNIQTGNRVGVRRGAGGIIIPTNTPQIILISDITEYGSSAFFGQWNKDGGFDWYSPQIFSKLYFTKICFRQNTVGFFGGIERQSVQIHDFPQCTFRYLVELDELTEEMQDNYGVGNAFSIAPDESGIFCPSQSGDVIELSVLDGSEIQRWRVHNSNVTAIALHPKNPWILSGASDGSLKVLSVRENPWDSRPVSKMEDFRDLFSVIGDSPEEHILFEEP